MLYTLQRNGVIFQVYGMETTVIDVARRNGWQIIKVERTWR